MLVYRLCWGEDLHIGFYCPGNDCVAPVDLFYKRRELTEKFQWGNRHPGPYDDAALYAFNIQKHYFGFDSPKALKLWFYKCHKTMTRLGCKVAVIKVKEGRVIQGKRQCVFDMKGWSYCKYFDITDPAWETYEGLTPSPRPS